MERSSGLEWAAEVDPCLAVSRAVDEDCNPAVVAVAALVEARFAVREAALSPDAVRVSMTPRSNTVRPMM